MFILKMLWHSPTTFYSFLAFFFKFRCIFLLADVLAAANVFFSALTSASELFDNLQFARILACLMSISVNVNKDTKYNHRRQHSLTQVLILCVVKWILLCVHLLSLKYSSIFEYTFYERRNYVEWARLITLWQHFLLWGAQSKSTTNHLQE